MHNSPFLKSYVVGTNGGCIYSVISRPVQFSNGILTISNGSQIAKNGISYLYGSSYVNYLSLFGIRRN